METKTQKSSSNPSRKKLFVSRLKKEWSERTLVHYFSRFGAINSCRLIKDPDDISKGYAILNLAHQSTADLILETTHVVKKSKIKLESFRDEQWTYRNRTAYISQIPSWMEDEKLERFFSKFGEVKEFVRQTSDKGHVTYASTNATKRATKLKNVKIEGFFLRVTKTEVTEEDEQESLESLRIEEPQPEILGSPQELSLENSRRNLGLYHYDNPRHSSLYNNPHFGVHIFPFLRGNTRYAQAESFESPHGRGQYIDPYYRGEFLEPKWLERYLKRIHANHPQIKMIPKSKLRSLELFFHNKSTSSSRLGTKCFNFKLSLKKVISNHNEQNIKIYKN